MPDAGSTNFSSGTNPFLYVTDPDGHPTGWALITGPVVTRSQTAQFEALLRAGYRFGGMPGYLDFPGEGSRDRRDYASLCAFWCHAFREPERYLPPGSPQALISYSDFTDYRRVSPERLGEADNAPNYDFIYAGMVEPWQREAKNWALAARCIPRICKKLGLRALVIGSPDAEFPAHPQVQFSPPLAWADFLERLGRARFLLAPNARDPSPRVLAEALCLDVPLVVYRRILGGWKYVNAFTGEFFDGEEDAAAAVERCLERPRSPRRWFRANYGPYLSGKRLLRLLRRVDPAFPNLSHVRLTPEAPEPSPPRR